VHLNIMGELDYSCCHKILHNTVVSSEVLTAMISNVAAYCYDLPWKDQGT
jgi:hypothetical protein